ncbi:lysophospholipid acyltransferase family protein [Nocardia cyriacigeorgica]|uniref:lysophospholipid acyltransferase family protein n=1 Tax=Nocardia cyriacigeorgica TaxID=135487 RepID=UPI0018932D2C|nr:lysophospholipid acyltransferase family protein [Nocardia cyriacigeorgica]MBF6413154.1 1-acyl-sn-glycerol-3-phosphate acyltransferase [Nocardia cyriacigeorgica]
MAREPVYDILTGLVRTVLWAQGLRIDIRGQELFPRTGGGVVAVNHTAYLDFMEVGLVGRNSGRNVRYMMKAELEHGIVGFLMKHCKAIGVDRTAGAESFTRAVEALRAGELVVVYPEATISRSFELKEFKSGAARMALEADVPIIPLAIWGAQRIWTKDIPKRLGRNNFPINIRIGAPVPPMGTPDELTARLRTELGAQLAAAQDGYPAPPGEPWVPARLGGGAPTLERAAELERAELAARQAKREAAQRLHRDPAPERE